MTHTTEQACAIAAVRLLRQAGEHDIANKLANDLMFSPLFEDEPWVATLTTMLVPA